MIPFEVQFQPLMNAMKKRREEVDKRARVAHEVFGKSTLTLIAPGAFLSSYELCLVRKNMSSGEGILPQLGQSFN